MLTMDCTNLHILIYIYWISLFEKISANRQFPGLFNTAAFQNVSTIPAQVFIIYLSI